MPNFKDLLAAKRAEEDKKQGTQSPQNNPDYQAQNPQQPSNNGLANKQQQPKPKTVFSGPQEKRATIGSAVQQKNDPVGNNAQRDPQATQGAQGADVTGRSWGSEAGASFIRGVGDHVVGGFGDIAQIVGSAIPGIDMFEGNVVSRFLQEKGSDIASQGELYMPEELSNPEFSIKTLTNPEFWSKHGVEYIPQLAELIFLSKGAGGLLKSGAQAATKQAVKKGLLKNTVGTLKNSSKKLAKGVDKSYDVTKGKGLGSLVKDTGELTAKAGIAIETFGAGAAGNIISGLLNSAEAYNSRKELVDENGNSLFNKDELADIASQTFQNNLAYMGIDILSWGMTYGNAGKLLKSNKIFSKGRKAFSSSKIAKNVAKGFTAKTSPTFRKIVNASGKALREGYEETFQETYESWAAMMAEHDVMGTQSEYDGFMDFYNSQENEGTKTIAFALGLLGGGASGLVQGVNKDAERARQLYDRTENLKTIFSNADEEGQTMQAFHRREMISDMVLQGKEDLFEEHASQALQDGILTEEEVAEMQETIEDYGALYDQADKLNIRGKYALFQAHTNENFFTEAIENENEKLQEVISILSESNLTEEQIASEIEKRTAETNRVVEGLSFGVAQAQANKANLILGKAIENVVEPVLVKDPKTGKEILATGLRQPNYKYYVEKSDEDILKKNNQAEVLKDNAEYDLANGIEPIKAKTITGVSGIGNKARSLFDKFFGKKEEQNEPANEEPENTPDNTSAEEEANNGEAGGDASAPGTETTNVDESEDGKTVSPETPPGKGPDQSGENNDPESGTTPEGETEPETSEELGDDVSEEELNEIADLQDQYDEVQSGKKDETPDEKIKREKEASSILEKIQEASKKLKSKKGKSKTKSPGVEFQNFVNKQNSNNEEQSGDQVEKVIQKTKKALQSVKKGIKNNLFKKIGKESRPKDDSNLNEFLDVDENQDPEEAIPFVENINPQDQPQIIGDSLWRIKNAPSDIDKMVAINERLNFMFPKPDARVNAYILDNLKNALGIRGTGLAVGGAIFVQSDKWDQGSVYMHEMAHIYYGFAKDRPETKSVVEAVKNNSELIQEIENRYPDEILYSFGEDVDGRPRIGTFNGIPSDQDLIDYNATRLPLDQQEVILEEAFVAYLQGPLSKKYNKFFGLRNEAKRETTTRKWWKMIDTKAKSDPEYLLESQQLLRKLNNGEDLNVNNMRDYIVMEFLKEVPKLESREIGFQSRSEDFVNDSAERKITLRNRLNEETASYNPVETKASLNQKEDALSQVLDEVSDNAEESDKTLSIAEKSFQSRTLKASKLINNFIKEYNKATRLRKTIWGRKGPLFDKKDFRYRIFKMSTSTENAIDFIDAIENSPQPDIQAFNKFMELRFPGSKTALLNSTWTLFSNQRMVAAVKSIISNDKDGIKHSIEESLSKREQNQVQTMLDNMQKARTHVQKKTGHVLGAQWRNFESIISRIEDDTATAEDYVEAWRFMSPPGTKILDILENGFMNVKGTYYSPVTVLKSFVDSKRHLGAPNANGTRYIHTYNFRPLANALMATNREYTQDSVVENAKGNMVPVRMMNNHMTKELDQMAASLRPDKRGNVMSKADFIKRYSHITRSKSYKKPVPNQFLENYYDSVIGGTRPDLVYYTGINDTTTNNANSFEDSTSYEQSFEDFMVYASSKNKTYLANVGVFGDSPRKYYMPTKRLNMSNAVNDAAYNIYKNISGDQISRRQFEMAYKEEQKAERAFFEKNGKELMKITSMKPFFDKNGKLNEKGRTMVNGYVYNQVMNGLFMAEVMSPNIKIDSIAKRLKNAGSPVISINKKLKFEPVFFKDPENNEASTDGGMFILREDADRWANAGKGVFDLNEGFKFLNYSIEKDNPKLRGQTVLLKGYTTILDEDFVKENPKFKGLYDLMQKRRTKMFDAHKKKFGTEPSMNFTDGLENSFPIAIPFSSEKTGMQKMPSMAEAPFLNQLTDSNSVEAAAKFQDSIMYDPKGKFVGVSGYNFGPQQVMDKVVNEVTLPVQQMNSLLVHATSLGNLAEAEAIQKLISEMMEGNLGKLTNALKAKNIETYKKIVKGEMNVEDMDQVQRFVIEKYGILHPRAIEIVSNQLANSIKSKGNKLRVEGTYAHQKSSYGWQLPVDGEINGSKDLNGYSEKADGSLNRAEIVLPQHLSNSGKIRPRKYYTIDSEIGKKAAEINDNKNYFDNSKTPKENDIQRLRNAANKFAEINNTSVEVIMKDGEVNGFYVPGETVIATRVPSNGPNFTGIFEVVGFGTGKGNQVQVPTSFSKIIGADLDGDALFVQHKGKNKKMNEVIDRMEKLWLSEDMAPLVQAPMETKKEGAKLKVEVLNSFAGSNEKYTVNSNDQILLNGKPFVLDGSMPFSPAHRRKSYEDSMVAKRNIGTVFNLHRMANTLAAYEASMNDFVTVDGEIYQTFSDGDKQTNKENPTKTRNHKSALIANLILDNLNENAADTLNINEHTVSAFTLLTNLNVPIEKVAKMMNAPMVKEYVAIMNENNSSFHGYTPKSQILKNLAQRPVKGKGGTVRYDSNSKGGVISDPNDPNFYSKSNQSHIINMIMQIDKVNEDLQKVSKILGGHNGIETNPYLLEKQVGEFKRIMSNENSTIDIPQAMAENPDLNRYLKTAEATLEHTKEIDLVYRPAMTKFLQGLAAKQGLDLLTDNQIKKYTKSIARYLHSKMSGFDNISKEELAVIVDPKNPEGVFQRLSDHMAYLKMEGKLENNTLLSQGLNMKFEGKNPYISMNSNFFDMSLNPQEVKKMNKEFFELPADLQYMLFHYDLTKNGWDSPLSFLPVTDSFLNNYIVQKLNEDFKNKSDQNYNIKDLRELEEILMLRDFNGIRNNIPTFQLSGPAHRVKEEMAKNPMFKKALLDNTPFYFKSKDKKGVTQLVRFRGNLPDAYNKPIKNEGDRLLHLATAALKQIEKVKSRTNKQLDIDLVTIGSNPSIKPTFKKKETAAERESRARDADINEVFDEHPELKKIGSKEQYKAFLKTVFPDSKLTHIVYHGTQKFFNQFSKKKTFSQGSTVSQSAIFFTGSIEAAKELVYYDTTKHPAHIIKSLINIKNPLIEDVDTIRPQTAKGYDLSFWEKDGYPIDKNIGYNTDLYDQIIQKAEKNKNDGIFLLNTIDAGRLETNDYVVWEPHQAHILGSERDQIGFKKFVKKNPDSKIEFEKPIGRESREEFWEYSALDYMDRARFDAAKEFDQFQTEDSKQKAFEEYIAQKTEANKIFTERFQGKDMGSYSPEALTKMYESYGAKDAYAYAIITTPIVKALAAKISAQQSNLTGRQKGHTDLGTIQSWLMANNIPSNHPEIQGMVRNMIKMEKQFQNEKKKYSSKINEVTNALYKDKFGFSFDSRNPIDVIKRFFYSYLYDRSMLYQTLYGNIVEENLIESEGKTISEFKLKDEKTINELRKNKQISDAEYEFYKTFRQITNELAPGSTSNGRKIRRDYIPHVSMGKFESFSKRGLLGLMQLSKNDNERLAEVQLYMNNPDTGKKELVRFKEIDTVYGVAAGKSKNDPKSIKEYLVLKNRAKKLLKQGKNEDGSDIQISDLDMDSAMSFGIMNRFSNSRSIKATEMPSMDLNHALNTYVHATLFVNGNDKFAGFKTMQGVVDGVLAFNADKGFKNASKYVKLNWKDYYLKGKRQELLGKKGDKVVDLITKINLFAQLGFKAAFVVGNVAAGKYHNIKNGSTKEWLTGEKRFWGWDAGSKNPFDIVKRFKRAQKILKTI